MSEYPPPGITIFFFLSLDVFVLLASLLFSRTAVCVAVDRVNLEAFGGWIATGTEEVQQRLCVACGALEPEHLCVGILSFSEIAYCLFVHFLIIVFIHKVGDFLVVLSVFLFRCFLVVRVFCCQPQVPEMLLKYLQQPVHQSLRVSFYIVLEISHV
ncbi:hypothetical protein QBC46DRAFT_398282 [Diplogelasinospora grovesii]|uniref:Uncharacterized protein n=1 Tax=Diplogelasinospora grovesii TaxID=303347 RepID=A0AAN6MY59_9PEZI|nr:hypothetical protein QBC46DRAFT_398282 [Diplogelasinospora grovesii]